MAFDSGPLTAARSAPVATSSYLTSESVVAKAADSVRGDLHGARGLTAFLAGVDRLSEQDKLNIVDQAICMLEGFYVHLPFKRAMHAVDPIQQLRILRHRLASVSSEFEFHHQMTKTFTALRDLHTNYILPSYFASMTAFLPFRVKHCIEGKQTKYLVAQVMSSVDDKNFVPGVELTYWNAVPIERAVELAANYHAGSNQAARHARGVDGLTFRAMSISPPPDEEWVTVGYRDLNGDSRDLRFEWTVTNIPSDSEAAAVPSTAAAMAVGLDIEGDTRRRMVDMLFRPEVKAAKSGYKRRRESAFAAATGRGETAAVAEQTAVAESLAGLESAMPDVLDAKQLSRDGKRYGYLRIRTFNVDDVAFVNEVARLLEHQDFPPNGLILDVRGNPGGVIWAGERLLQLFTPEQIEPTRVQFIATPLTKTLCEHNDNLKEWYSSIERATETGATFSAAYPITPPERCNDIGQRYYGPVVLVVDARCYSTTDMFAAGFRDHGIGKILGVDDNMGAGGANVWTLDLIRRLSPRVQLGPLKEALPRQSNMRVAIRRTIRVGAEAGTVIEDLGIKPDEVRPLTRNDLLHQDADLLGYAMEKLAAQPSYTINVTVSESGGHTNINVSVANIARLDTYVADRPLRSDDMPAGTLEMQIAAPPKSTVELRGFNGKELVACRRLTLGGKLHDEANSSARNPTHKNPVRGNLSREVTMADRSHRNHRSESRMANNDEFVERLVRRRPEVGPQLERMRMAGAANLEGVAEAAGMRAEAAGLRKPTLDEMVKETIVFRERPVLFVKQDWIDREDVEIIGDEAQDLVDRLADRKAQMRPLFPLIGRIDVTNFPNIDYLGTGWFVDSDIVVTNRHVASLFAKNDGRKFVFRSGIGGKPMTSSLNTMHEFDDGPADADRVFAVTEVLYIEPEGKDRPDIAFLRVKRRTSGATPNRIPIAKADVGEDTRVLVVGYPARAPRDVIPDQDLMKRLYRGHFDVKRAAPGFTMSPREGTTRHDCTTLGGNSGSVVLNLDTGEAVGLHFAGLYQESNFAVRASLLNQYVTGKRWNNPIPVRPDEPEVKPGAKPIPSSVGTAGTGTDVTITLPLSISVSLGQQASVQVSAGQASARTGPSQPGDAAGAEAAATAFWDKRPEGVLAVRVGYLDDGDKIGDTPCIAASVAAGQLADFEARGDKTYQSYEIRYIPATIGEQAENIPGFESVDSIAYDDSARTGEEFSFERVSEQMSVRAHVGPEFSWSELNGFLSKAKGHIISAMYEFHAPQIKDAIEDRLEAGAELTLVLDNATFSKVKDEDMEFDRIAVFNSWDKKFKDRFARIVAPEGLSGLISDSYHIKVTVRSDDTFWLSSGNWKKESSQPVITQDELDNATQEDLPGNREWHVIVKNKTLASRFRHHILQDFKQSDKLGGGKVPKSKEAADIFVDVPIEEAVVEERRAPSRLVEPQTFDGRISVTPLLTPDQEGAVYSEAVLSLIRSARKSLLFQIPYIGMPPNPRADRGFIDELIKALTDKLNNLEDARVILRSGSAKFSSPAHAAWFFKSKGVDIDNRLRVIDNHHTKGMIVDGKRVLIGSHNWSKPGVTLNRDASLIFDNDDIAGYFAQAFEIDWERSNLIKPKRFVQKKKEASVLEAVTAEPPKGYRRVRLSELLKEDD